MIKLTATGTFDLWLNAKHISEVHRYRWQTNGKEAEILTKVCMVSGHEYIVVESVEDVIRLAEGAGQ